MWLYPEVRTLADLVGHHARNHPQRTALIDDAGRRTFAQLDAAASGVAAGLAGRVQPGDRIAIIGQNSIPFLELMFGAVRAGCVFVPLNWRLSAAEIAVILEDCTAGMVFVEAQFADMVVGIRARCAIDPQIILFTREDDIATVIAGGAPVGAPAPVPHDPRRTALLMYTSGTTGKPKGVQLSHQTLVFRHLCVHLQQEYDWIEGDIFCLVLPLFHLAGLDHTIQVLYHGCTVSILPVMNVPQMLERLRADRPTVTSLVPTALGMLLDHPSVTRDAFSSLRLVTYGASAIDTPLLKRALAAMDCQFLQLYGATETCGAVTILGPSMHDPSREHQLKSCGKPLPLIDIRILDPQGDEVPHGSIGEMVIRTPALLEGYWNRPEATAEVIDGGWYRTGDAGYRDDEGLFYVVDRIKDMIVTGGENVYSAEVEHVILGHDAVKASAVIGLPDPHWGERVVAVVVLKDGARVTPEELIAHCRQSIAGFKVPKEVRFVDALPHSAAGKILKRELRLQVQTEPA